VDAAEGDEAIYTLADRVVVMTGDVLLTQEQSAISGEVLTVQLDDGTGVMEGRVRTILQTGGN
jgi:lipopolysaccharide export system protein LptA